MAGDSTKPYGDVSYADPGYQTDGKKRYPLVDSAHCRNAWSRINDPENAAKYSPAQLKRIKSRIRAAGKRYGISFAEDVKASAGRFVAAAAGSFTGVELGRPGKWLTKNGPREFTAQDFKDAADFFEATGRQRIPIGPGHSDPRFDGDPAFGWVENMRYAEDAEGPVLLGDLVDMDDWVAAAAPRRFPKRSIEGWQNFDWNGRTYSLALTRLALLGNTPPAMPNLRSLTDLREAIAAAAATCGAEFFAASALDEGSQDPAPEAVVHTHQEQEAGMDPAKIRERLGLDDDVSDDEVMEALAYAGFVPAPETPAATAETPAPVAASAPPLAPTPGSTILVEASAWNDREDRLKRLEAAEQRHRDGERDQIITAAITEGKFTPARRDHWVRAWNLDPEGTRQAIGSLAKGLVPIAASGYSTESDEDMDAELARFYPPTARKGA